MFIYAYFLSSRWLQLQDFFFSLQINFLFLFLANIENKFLKIENQP
jgi:hypothetical protein